MPLKGRRIPLRGRRIRRPGRARRVVPILVAALMASGGCGDQADAGGASEPAGATGASGSAASGGADGTSEADAGPAVVGRAPSATGGIPAMVTLEPVGGTPIAGDTRVGADTPDGGDTPVGEGSFPPPVVDQFGLAFLPPVLVVRAGGPVTFTNSEGALVHNVHIRSIEGDSTVFNGDTAPGEELSVELPSAGGYDVLCDMHPGMTAFLFVTDAPYTSTATPDGRFRFDGVPPGTYAALVWTTDGGLGEPREVEVRSGTTELDLTSPPR